MKTLPSSAVRFINPSDEKPLADFLLALKSKTLYHWNRFGNSFTPKSAAKVASAQISKNVSEEQGFVIYDGSRLIGYCYLRFFPDKPQKSGTASLGMVVRDGYQSRGVGKRMMEAMINYCRDRKIIKIWLATYSDNERTQPFYKKFGFLAEGIFMFDEYFGKKPRHVISMAKFLNPKLQKAAFQLKKRYLLD